MWKIKTKKFTQNNFLKCQNNIGLHLTPIYWDTCTVILWVSDHLMCSDWALKWGRAIWPKLHEMFGCKRPWSVFTSHVVHDDLYAKTDKLLAKIVSLSKMANNQLPPCSFSMSEFLQWWTFIPAKKEHITGL